MTALLKVTDLVSGYLNRPVLHGVSLQLNSGDAVAIIGPNGHGKTTFLRCLSGLLKATSGTISFLGQDVSHEPAHRRVAGGMVHVPQGDQLFADMSVEENLFMGAYRAEKGANLKYRLDEVYALFPRLAERRGQVTKSLSGGERRMVGIGRGLMAKGELLILDEPSLGLAPKVIEEIYAALVEKRRDGASILIVEEDPSRVSKVADQIYLMDAGHFVWSGSPDEAAASEDVMQTYLGGK
ncbi:ABC transporter ATP-binding protein [Celeribacter naphthalenivorans]|uniref:ABC transporter ATP-binding protein n=1 Tax=Celeribacter naphthalenivorans TaxID=1614694 RepID=UPI001CFAEA3B|nr:ABC transporter ATP-binding protein [Celeribacter naphthalenivorans]